MEELTQIIDRTYLKLEKFFFKVENVKINQP